MAGGAIGRSKGRSRRRVRRIIRLLPGRQMASGIPAVRRLNCQRRIVPHMALVAARDLSGRRNLVRIRQRETGTGVVECRIRPQNRVVAGRTERCRKSRCNVVWHGAAKRRRAVPGRLVTPVAIRVRGGERIVVAHMAIRAGHHFACGCHLVRARQRPTGCRVIKRYVCP